MLRLKHVSAQTLQKVERQYRLLTHSMRATPQFIILGTMKGGTTSLYRNLGFHPEIILPHQKELRFFDRFYSRGMAWYQAYFPSPLEAETVTARMNHKHWITGESTPNYLLALYVAARLRQTLPEVKLIVMLREPVARAYSHYSMNVRNSATAASEAAEVLGKEARVLNAQPIDRATFERFVYDWVSRPNSAYDYPKDVCERKGSQGEPKPYRDVKAYLLRSLYVEQMRVWFDYFPREQFLILKSEDYFANPQHYLEEVVPAFLGIAPWKVDSIKQSSQEGASYPKIDPGLRDELKAVFKPYNQELYDLLGVDFGW